MRNIILNHTVRNCRSQNSTLFCSCKFYLKKKNHPYWLLANQKSDRKMILPQEHGGFSTSAWGLWCPLNVLWYSSQKKSIFSPDILGNVLLKTKYTANHNRPRAWLEILSCAFLPSVPNRSWLKDSFKKWVYTKRGLTTSRPIHSSN